MKLSVIHSGATTTMFTEGEPKDIWAAIQRGETVRCVWFGGYDGTPYVEDFLFMEDDIKCIRTESDPVTTRRIENLLANKGGRQGQGR